MNKKERERGSLFKRKVGDEFDGFWTEEGAKKKAIKYFKEHLSDYDVLICGRSSVCDPQECLFAYDEDIKKKLDDYYNKDCHGN